MVKVGALIHVWDQVREKIKREREIQSHCGRFTVYTHMYIHIFMYVYVYIYIHIYIYTHKSVCMYIV